ncbi:hypothetical protein CW705_05510 [Candidatus Bathyarchaeota archaeon]|nr:MAG: hypothetical protein CW705_05510 [Candidatus Bathyarchaeota archaeon]
MVSREDEVKNRFRYLDILISAIVDHEKNLNDLILKLEKTVEKLSEIVEKIRKAEKLKEET